MKFIVLMLTVALMSGCAGFGDTSDAGDWYGIMGAENFNNHSARQIALQEERERAKTAILLQEKLRAAISNGNTEEVDKITNMMQKVWGTEAGGCKKLRLRNATNVPIRVESAPFDGVELNPGAETSGTFCVPIGSYRLEYKECSADWNKCSNASASIYVDRNRTESLVVRYK